MHRTTKIALAGAAALAVVAPVVARSALASATEGGSSSGKGSGGVAQLRILSTDLAQQAAGAAFKACSAQGHRVTVSVVGRDGGLLALVRNEQAGVASIDSATGKA